MNTPLVSVIVLSYGGRRARDTVQCVHSLLQQSIADQIEIIVADNHSEDDSIGILRNQLSDLESVSIVEVPQHRGFGRGNNYASEFAKGEYFLVINPDNILEKEGLSKMVSILETDDSIGLIAPKLVYPDGTIRDSFRPFPRAFDVCIKRTPLRHLFPNRMKEYTGGGIVPETETDYDWIAGACFLMKSSLYKDLEGFDPRFFLFFEDIDLCRRIWDKGKRVVFSPNIIAKDGKERLSQGGLITFFTKKTVRFHIKSAFQYFWKWRGVPMPR
ncbi:glycosyltransferase family 2 protein [Candidatus Peregrinibacteria bacterium]|jgi:GT2 family glycosyltransferase|nr:glycosyltransferase family 2 protein [Candidatus Peregrinibacteria bacterium]MBT3598825.1 glycosyltransferase family 2 protein [Candidatus Peregrinibacteria bacterium]MBT4367213.1 glycosyltransferase family 2 protein [Candidatus Peregrinibacteria bacterium]MBT4585403.1 glycosyltransferase family 2 protein [Candidatus Peregrinibacteria bacterium]MBT6731165.1 glycosyltransferase family 2 protein [Candidatus Peregrinibacteria bacterium]